MTFKHDTMMKTGQDIGDSLLTLNNQQISQPLKIDCSVFPFKWILSSPLFSINITALLSFPLNAWLPKASIVPPMGLPHSSISYWSLITVNPSYSSIETADIDNLVFSFLRWAGNPYKQ